MSLVIGSAFCVTRFVNARCLFSNRATDAWRLSGKKDSTVVVWLSPLIAEKEGNLLKKEAYIFT